MCVFGSKRPKYDFYTETGFDFDPSYRGGKGFDVDPGFRGGKGFDFDPGYRDPFCLLVLGPNALVTFNKNCSLKTKEYRASRQRVYQ